MLLFKTKIRRCFSIKKNEQQINAEIKDATLRVIAQDGSQLGIISLKEALERAEAANLDLVKIAPNATPPVAKIMDYGKYCFEQAKREKEQRKNQKTIEVKEIYLSVKIDTHDFNTKCNAAIKFLKAGNKVKVAVKFRGREMAHTNLGQELLARFRDACEENAVVDKPPKMEGRNMSMFLSPKPSK